MAGPPAALVCVCKHWLLPSLSKSNAPGFNATLSIFGAACQAERLLSYRFSNAVSGREESDQRCRSP